MRASGGAISLGDSPTTREAAEQARASWGGGGGGEGARGKRGQQNAPRTQSRSRRAECALDRVRRIAARNRDAKFTALLHHVDVDRLRASYWALRPKAAPGVDGVTWVDFGQVLERISRIFAPGSSQGLPGEAGPDQWTDGVLVSIPGED